MESMSSKNLKLLNILLILLGFLLTGLFCYGHLIDGDVVQIINKAHLFVTKNLVTPYGSASSSGVSGVVPGPFLTLAVGLPMKIWFSPWSALLFLSLLHFLAFLMIQSVIGNFVSHFVGTTVFIIFFWLNPWRLSEVFLWNPGYIFFVSGVHFWSSWKMSKKPDFLPSLIHTLSLFMGLQVHPSFIILFFMSLILIGVRAIRLSIKGVFFGFILGFVSLVPFFMTALENPELFIKPGGDSKGFLFFGLVAVYPLLKGIWYWILFGSNIFQTHVFHQLNFNWTGSQSLGFYSQLIWPVIKYAFGIFGLCLSFYANVRFFRSALVKISPSLKTGETLKTGKTKRNPLLLKKLVFCDFLNRVVSGVSHFRWIEVYGLTGFLSAVFAVALSPHTPYLLAFAFYLAHGSHTSFAVF